MNQDRIVSLDAMRGLAAMAVVIFHFVHLAPVGARPLEAILWPLYRFGHYAVPLFFMLSGVIFFAVYADRLATGVVGAWEFFVLRLSRLYPLHIASLAAVAALQVITNQQVGGFFIYQMNDAPHVLYNLLMIQFAWFPTGFSFNGPSWSLAVEVGLYISFFAFVRVYGGSALSLAIAAAASTVLYALPVISWYAPFNPFFLQGIACFFIGGCLRALVSSPVDGRFVDQGATVFAVTGVVVTYLLSVKWGLMLLLFPALIIGALRSEVAANISRHAALRWLGEVSYSIYMWHFAVQLLFFLTSRTIAPIDFSSPGILASYILATLAVGGWSYKWLERPAKVLIRKALLEREPAARKPGVESLM